METEIVYTSATDGVSLPVIDVTNPAFAVAATDAELADLSDKFIAESEKQKEIQAALQEALRHSVLGRALMSASGKFVPGMSTYLMKLGPGNLGAEANPIDRAIAASFPAFSARLRLQDMARLLADGLSRIAEAEHRKPICFINIGGGPASDSWNALIHLYATNLDSLVLREISIVVLDIDDAGPAFGARAVQALCAPGAPLGGLDISLRHLPYEWSNVSGLQEILAGLHTADKVCAVSSEGGLFEYGSDTEIVANLTAIHAGTSSDAIVVGSVTRDDEPTRATQRGTQICTQPRTIEAFRTLVGRAGWRVQEVTARPFSYNIRMVKDF